MDIFFTILKKGLVATMFVVFAFVATYVPQPFNHIDTVEAGALGGGATEPTQIANNVQLGAVNVATTASAAANSITSWATGSLWVKENILDGIGWAIAKRIVSSMVQSLINWINSGFQGSPAFVQDLKGFLLQVADEAIGEFIEDLGGIGSFICSPFRLDVQVSIATQYAQGRDSGQTAPSCTLSGIIDNIEGFISGSFSAGGWDDWFDITSTPQTYTPYGAVLSAEAGARAKLINAKGEELTLLDWGDGFLSGEICEAVEGAGTSRENCFISKPGKIIEEALSFNLDSGRQSLITADEINEIIAALLGQLANTALTGVAGLLGLSGGTGHTYSGFSGGSYLDELVASSSELIDIEGSRLLMVNARAVQSAYRDLALEYRPRLQAYSTNIIVNPDAIRRAQASSSARQAATIIVTASSSMGTIDTLIGRLDEATLDRDVAEQSKIITEFTQLTLYSKEQIETSRAAWDTILR